MNFESEADVHVFIERQLSGSIEAESPDTYENEVGLTQQSRRGAGKRGEFGELLAKSLSQEENVAPDNYTPKLEDMFADEAENARYAERFFENPMLCNDGDENCRADQQQQRKQLRLKDLKDVAGSIGSFVVSMRPSLKDPMSTIPSTPESVMMESEGGDLPLPKPKNSSVGRKSRMGEKRVSWDAKTFIDYDAMEEEEEYNQNRRFSLVKSIRSSLHRLPSMTSVLSRFGNFRRDQIIRDPGSGLELPRRPTSASGERRKSSKTTVTTEGSRESVGNRVKRMLNISGAA